MRRSILITGASAGLGAEMARQFAARGCGKLALCARRLERLQALKHELERDYPALEVSIKALDVDDHDQVFEVFEAFDRELGGIDRVIVNAGIGKGASLGTGYFYANRQTAVTNFVSALAQCEAALELFRRRNAGHLVVISSVSALRGFRRATTTYAATKAALSALAEGIRIDLLDTPIAVTTIHPGYIRTDINAKVERVPFIVEADVGGRAMVDAIEREPANAYVPRWPWALARYLLPIAPLSLLRRLS